MCQFLILKPKKRQAQTRIYRYFLEIASTKRISLLDAQVDAQETVVMIKVMLGFWLLRYPSVVKPLMQHGKSTRISRVATTNMMMTNRGSNVLSDTAINPNPSADDLAKSSINDGKR
jgi:malate dehydrogenase (oxaloacetate-decarboxylating)(NADP+)